MAGLEDLSQESRDELALLARELSDNPKTRKNFLKIAKEVRPNLPVPELELDSRLDMVTENSEKRIRDLESRLAEKDLRSELERRRQSLISNGLAKDMREVEAIEKVMLDKKIQNHETAAEYVKLSRESAPPTPVGYNRSVLDEGTRSALSKYWKNPVAAARDEAARALGELRRNPKPLG